MFGFKILVVYFIAAVSGFPTNYLRKIAESHQFDDFENYLPKYDDVPNFQFSTNNLEDDVFLLNDHEKSKKIKENSGKTKKNNLVEDALLKIDFSQIPVQDSDLSTIEDISQGSTQEPDALLKIDFSQIPVQDSDLSTIEDISQGSTQEPEHSTTVTTLPGTEISTTVLDDNLETTTTAEAITMPSVISKHTSQLEPSLEFNTSDFNETNRLPRQEVNDTKSDPEFESQEADSSEEDENMITGLLSAFLGGLSRPDGSIDLEAIVGLLGSLSSQKEDGSYDFQGLTDLLRGFFGGGGDEGGGSDIGAFVGGLLGAAIKGIANPPGAKGAGILTGKIVTGVLPALSGPAPADNMEDKPQPEGLDSGGFLSGLLKTVLGSSTGGTQEGGGGSKFNIFKLIFSSITSVFTASSTSH